MADDAERDRLMDVAESGSRVTGAGGVLSTRIGPAICLVTFPAASVTLTRMS